MHCWTGLDELCLSLPFWWFQGNMYKKERCVWTQKILWGGGCLFVGILYNKFQREHFWSCWDWKIWVRILCEKWCRIYLQSLQFATHQILSRSDPQLHCGPNASKNYDTFLPNLTKQSNVREVTVTLLIQYSRSILLMSCDVLNMCPNRSWSILQVIVFLVIILCFIEDTVGQNVHYKYECKKEPRHMGRHGDWKRS